eukprot:TRINITY_DN15810_c0_g1_i2.p1 TRINITY_DN15810_c0_g1~~TRINITY_DN15810_c0_g1_i2.p1  ORF type:complete len:973 (+),score=144.65 TRINITY_DN15810_c0_g1_i2:37-2955(+)
MALAELLQTETQLRREWEEDQELWWRDLLEVEFGELQEIRIRRTQIRVAAVSQPENRQQPDLQKALVQLVAGEELLTRTQWELSELEERQRLERRITQLSQALVRGVQLLLEEHRNRQSLLEDERGMRTFAADLARVSRTAVSSDRIRAQTVAPFPPLPPSPAPGHAELQQLVDQEQWVRALIEELARAFLGQLHTTTTAAPRGLAQRRDLPQMQIETRSLELTGLGAGPRSALQLQQDLLQHETAMRKTLVEVGHENRLWLRSLQIHDGERTGRYSVIAAEQASRANLTAIWQDLVRTREGSVRLRQVEDTRTSREATAQKTLKQIAADEAWVRDAVQQTHVEGINLARSLFPASLSALMPSPRSVQTRNLTDAGRGQASVLSDLLVKWEETTRVEIWSQRFEELLEYQRAFRDHVGTLQDRRQQHLKALTHLQHEEHTARSMILSQWFDAIMDLDRRSRNKETVLVKERELVYRLLDRMQEWETQSRMAIREEWYEEAIVLLRRFETEGETRSRIKAVASRDAERTAQVVVKDSIYGVVAHWEADQRRQLMKSESEQREAIEASAIQRAYLRRSTMGLQTKEKDERRVIEMAMSEAWDDLMDTEWASNNKMHLQTEKERIVAAKLLASREFEARAKWVDEERYHRDQIVQLSSSRRKEAEVAERRSELRKSYGILRQLESQHRDRLAGLEAEFRSDLYAAYSSKMGELRLSPVEQRQRAAQELLRLWQTIEPTLNRYAVLLDEFSNPLRTAVRLLDATAALTVSFQLGKQLLRRGSVDEAKHCFVATVRCAVHLGCPQEESWGYAGLAEVYQKLEGTASPGRARPQPGQPRESTYRNLADAHFAVGRYANAVHFYTQELNALHMRRDPYDPTVEARVVGGIALSLAYLGEAEALTRAHEAYNLLDGGSKLEQLWAFGMLGECYSRLGDYATSVRYHRRELALALEIGSGADKAKAYGNLSRVLRHLCTSP